MIGTSNAARSLKVSLPAAERLQQLLVLLTTHRPANAAPVAQPGALPLGALSDLAGALLELGQAERPRSSVRIRQAEEHWEVALERRGSFVCASVFTGGALPVVHAHELRVDARLLADRLEQALALLAADGRESERSLELRDRLAGFQLPTAPNEEPELVVVEPLSDTALALSAELSLRPGTGSALSGSSVLRSDLASLLFRGRLCIRAFDHERQIPDVHVFLVAEQLAALTLEALEAQAAMRPLWRKVQVGGASCGIRLAQRQGERAEGAALTLGPARSGLGRGETWTFPLVDLEAFASSIVDFGRALCRSLVRRDRTQTQNLRLVEFRSKLREIASLCREATRDDAIVNSSPESYRAYAARQSPSRDSAPLRSRLRYAPRWTAAVPSIDLRGTFLCGDSFVVGSARELCALDRQTGELRWRRSVSRATSVATPLGVARFDGEGQLGLVDLATGETRFSLRLAPRVGAPVTGALVTTPGLPRMLLLSEGKRHIAAVDLDAGEIAWRYAARRGGPVWLRRAGRLVVVSNGEQALTALDVVSGEVVWRYCDRLRFAGPVAVSHDSLFAIAGDGALSGRGGARLVHLDPWTGESRWSVPLPAHTRAVGAPMVAPNTVLVGSRHARGSGVAAFDARTGELRFDRDVCRGAAASLVVDDLLVQNSESGELCALDTSDGTTRYRHVFADGNDGDRPRRLDPVLRSGALFVPQSAVHVVRPQDGTLLGSVPTDLVPDLLRVDEHCDVYVGEESGHLAAFGTVRLTLVHG